MTKLTSRISIIAMTILTTACLTACDIDKTPSEMIPSVDDTSIEDAADVLGVSLEDFNAFLDNLNLSYDDYMGSLNKSNKSLSELKESIETMYDCTYSEYIKTIVAVNNKTVPDSSAYSVFTSEYSLYDAYIPVNELDDTKSTLINYDIHIKVADTDNDAYAFDAIVSCGGDFKTYVDTLNREYDCSSVEFTNISLYGGHGSFKPDETNACMDNLFVYDPQTNEILEVIIVPVMTLHSKDESKNITLALSNELGLIFRTEGADSYDKMLKLSNLNFQIRDAELSENVTESNDN